MLKLRNVSLNSIGGMAIPLLLLWGMFLLSFPIFVQAGLLLSLLFFALFLFARLRIDEIGCLVGLNFIYWLISGALVGSFAIKDFATTDFWDGDGRIFLYYLPLLTFSVMSINKRQLVFIAKQIACIGFVSIVFFSTFVLSSHNYFSIRKHDVFIGLLTSHTGAGAFFAGIMLFLLFYGHIVRNRYMWYLGMLMILPVLGTGCRQALVSLIGVFVWFVFSSVLNVSTVRKHFIKIVGGGLLVITITVFTPILLPYTYKAVSEVISVKVFQRLSETAHLSDWQPGEYKSEGGVEWDYHNLQTRIVFWKYSLKKFLESPLVGIGFARYNDSDLSMYGIPHFIYLAVDGNKFFLCKTTFDERRETILNAASAHNSYLHVLAESGVIGFLLMMWLWKQMFVRLKRGRLCDDINVRAFYTAGQGLLVFSLIAAFSGHALAAPSTGILVTTIVGACLSYQRTLVIES